MLRASLSGTYGLIDKLSNLILFMVSSAEYAASEFTTYNCAVMHTKEENIFFKKVQKHTESKMAACLHGNSRWPLFL